MWIRSGKNPDRAVAALVALATLGSGVINIYSVIGQGLPARIRLLHQLFPLSFVGISRSLTLLIGFALVISSLNIFKRKRRAWYTVAALAAASAVFHITKGIDYEEAACSLLLLALLAAVRRHFTVKSRTPDLRDGLLRLGLAFLIAFGYGVAGFWLLDARHFGIDFHIGAAVRHTLLFLSLAGDPQVIPYTRYAHWFVQSLYLITGVAAAYSGLALFRPVLYLFAMHPQERAAARDIVARHGISSLDYFKTWEDKSYFFSRSGRSFIAYRVAGSFAVALGDPVGPPEETEAIIAAFARFCADNDWGAAFYQALPASLEIYRRAGFKHLKIGDDAIVELDRFTLQGKSMKATRTALRRLESLGIECRVVGPPLPEDVLGGIAEVSREWLTLPGKRERSFTLGRFDREYLRQATAVLALDAAGRVLAFANVIHSGRRGEMTADLMRRRCDAPNGIMDLLFVRLFEYAAAQGCRTFNLGMAPMAGFQEHEAASAEERAIHALFRHLNFLFSFKGLRAYKAKFATHWEPRYAYYSSALHLPRLALALGRVSEHRENRRYGQSSSVVTASGRLGLRAIAATGKKLGRGARSYTGRLFPSRDGGAAAAAQSIVRAR